MIFVCENNLYGASTHVSLSMKIEDVASRAAGYGIPGVVVDGMDVLAVNEAMTTAVQRAVRGEGPTFLECKTYRYLGHSRGDPGGYRTKEEVEHWRRRDPIPRFRKVLINTHKQAAKDLDTIEQQCQRDVEASVEFAVSSPDPDPQTVLQHIYAPREGRS